ncbi:MAG: hypothetical protein QM779_03815 [Propionicimonas sp.]|uniref:hypothetical protein n=1 Tax=Propionicimonas sp. TaxID=1955623 RepID=UPI003D0A11F2
MPSFLRHRPAAVLVAVAGTALVGVAVVVLAVASLASGHGGFSSGVAIFLVGYGALMLGAAWVLWRLSVFGRGPVLALSLLNLITAWTFTADAPWVWVVVVISAATVVAAALPATSRALHRGGVTRADAPPPTADQGR